MIIAIDSGNTASKVGVFEHGNLVNTFEKTSYQDLIRLVLDLNPARIIISTVKIPRSDFIRDLPAERLFLCDQNTPLPIRILYNTPSTLGIDRIALSVGGWNEFPDRNILIISAGTCITYDFVNSKGEYLGGGISPGIHMRLRSLHQFTANLPLVKFTENPPAIGNSTENSILSGVVHGTLAEISGFIQMYRHNFGDIRVIFSGGDVKFFESKLKDSIFAIPNLVLKGIYSIFSYNDKPT
jgi:type III pantothenate kinase